VLALLLSFIVNGLFISFFSSLENYNLTLFVVSVSTLILILLIFIFCS